MLIKLHMAASLLAQVNFNLGKKIGGILPQSQSLHNGLLLR
jgi:hypothetical protein